MTDKADVVADVQDGRFARFVFNHPNPAAVDTRELLAALLGEFGAHGGAPLTLPVVAIKLELVFDLGESS